MIRPYLFLNLFLLLFVILSVGSWVVEAPGLSFVSYLGGKLRVVKKETESCVARGGSGCDFSSEGSTETKGSVFKEGFVQREVAKSKEERPARVNLVNEKKDKVKKMTDLKLKEDVKVSKGRTLIIEPIVESKKSSEH